MAYKVQIDDLVRDANQKEIKNIDSIIAETEAEKVDIETKASAKAAAKAKLTALGLDVDDLCALGL